MNEALNSPLSFYILHQPIILKITRLLDDRVLLSLKNRTGREICLTYHDYNYEKLKEATLYSIQQIKEYRQKLKLDAIEKDFK